MGNFAMAAHEKSKTRAELMHLIITDRVVLTNEFALKTSGNKWESSCF